MRREYPTEEELKTIRKWDITEKGVKGLLWKLEDVWNTNYGVFTLTGKRVLKLVLVTGGWSGNEDIIDALSHNHFWRFHWQESKRGGRFTFRVNTSQYDRR